MYEKYLVRNEYLFKNFKCTSQISYVINKKLLSSAKRSANRKQLAEPDVVLGGPYFLNWNLDFTDWTGLDWIGLFTEWRKAHAMASKCFELHQG